MKDKNRSAGYSVDSVAKALMCLLIPVLTIDILAGLYVVFSMRSQSIQNLQNTTSLYVSQIDTERISINKYLLRCLNHEKAFQTALQTQDTLKLIQSCNKVQDHVHTFLESFHPGYQFFLYNKKLDRLFHANDAYTYNTFTQIQQINYALRSQMQAASANSYTEAWQILSLPDGVYFYKFFYSGSHYVGCYISADNATAPIKQLDLGKDSFISLTALDGTPLMHQEPVKKGQITISGSPAMGAFIPHIVMDKYRAYEKVILFQFLIEGAMALIATALFISIFYMKRRVLIPIREFSENLSQLDDNAPFMDLKDSRLTELKQANRQFKKMMRQIEKLKIGIYETELDKQQTLMNYLQLQIRPHFFLNCLNTIYSMAQTQLYNEIMQMSMATSSYFRYIFHDSGNFVPLRRELEHIEYYMRIQKMRLDGSFSYTLYTDEGIGEMRILPILLQTFIENSIKHSVSNDTIVKIQLEAEWIYANGDPRGNMQIRITDTGHGFPADVLKDLNTSGMLAPVEGRRIGITNALNRLKLFYREGETAVTFSNLPSGGACVTLLLPAQPSEGGKSV